MDGRENIKEGDVLGMLLLREVCWLKAEREKEEEEEEKR